MLEKLVKGVRAAASPGVASCHYLRLPRLPKDTAFHLT
jgi:hypothetical protein